ncbi:hypothetical protein [Bacillus cihuensis]|uniref:hypothetical protein n=1 Tax=Bacillus cihuensis TaxID=1208599 RepID=UPI0004089391|nr:hypothetical protein [Bacillus cihuensis]
MDKLETQVTKLPSYIKQWYADRAKKFGQKAQPYASMILIQYAIENGAEEPKDKRKFDKGDYMIEH